jgi:hypothetical protein
LGGGWDTGVADFVCATARASGFAAVCGVGLASFVSATAGVTGLEGGWDAGVADFVCATARASGFAAGFGFAGATAVDPAVLGGSDGIGGSAGAFGSTAGSFVFCSCLAKFRATVETCPGEPTGYTNITAAENMNAACITSLLILYSVRISGYGLSAPP